MIITMILNLKYLKTKIQGVNTKLILHTLYYLNRGFMSFHDLEIDTQYNI